MSLILDALKKSERERQRDKTPGLQSIHQPLPRRETPSRKHWWLITVVVVLNAGVLGYWRFQQSTASKSAPTTAIETLASNPSVAAGQKEGAPLNAALPPSPIASEFTQITPTQMSANKPQGDTSLRIDEVGELPDDIRNNLPAMTFSFHVYSTNAQQRTIIINNKRMREGDEISAGLQLQEITEDGVILLTAGRRVHIGVLSGW
jgi:general secretion pathway protein B